MGKWGGCACVDFPADLHQWGAPDVPRWQEAVMQGSAPGQLLAGPTVSHVSSHEILGSTMLEFGVHIGDFGVHIVFGDPSPTPQWAAAGLLQCDNCMCNATSQAALKTKWAD